MKRLPTTLKSNITARCRPHARNFIIVVSLTLALVCLIPRPAYAIFGFGDIVYDPSNFAEAVAQVEQDIKLVAQGLQTYDLLKSELRMIQQRPWQTLATQLGSIAVADLGPEARPEAQALATAANGISDPRSAWHTAMMTMPMDALTPALASSLANTSAPSNTASIQITDAFATDSLRTVGAWRQNQTSLNNAIAALQSAQESTGDADNTPVAQANITNGALLQLLKLQQSNASLQAVLAEQLTAANSWQRNTAAEAITIQSQSITSRMSAPADYSKTSATLTDYLIN